MFGAVVLVVVYHVVFVVHVDVYNVVVVGHRVDVADADVYIVALVVICYRVRHSCSQYWW